MLSMTDLIYLQNRATVEGLYVYGLMKNVNNSVMIVAIITRVGSFDVFYFAAHKSVCYGGYTYNCPLAVGISNST